MKKKIIIIFALFVQFSFAQQPFSVSLVQSPISAMPSVQSGAFAEWNGKWIFIGGRREGLHNFQFGIGFSTTGRNDSIFVVDPVANQRWSSDLSVLPVDEFESLCSTNMEFYQVDSTLYMMGGYGKSTTLNGFETFPLLTAVSLNSLVNAVMTGDSVATSFTQIADTNIAVAGGHLEKIDSTYYLIFGHNFSGQYDKTPGSILFVQHYTNSVRKFNINDNGSTLSVNNFSSTTDTDNFHRRDLNTVEQIFQNGEYGFTAFGGVFQKTATLPYLTPIDITANGTQLNSSFNQNLNQYETASIPVYDSINNFMHTVFFGGMSLYTLDTVNHILVQDTLIPFVNTISKISRDGAGNLSEYKLPVEMPSLIGTDACFIPDHSINIKHNSIIDLNSLSGNTRVGWIISGIQSDFANIADLDPMSMSRPNTTVYEVWIDVTPDAIHDLPLSNNILGLNVYPNPTEHISNIDFTMNESGNAIVEIFDEKGIVLKKFDIAESKSKLINIPLSTSTFAAGLYTCVIRTAHGTKEAKFVVR